MDTFGSRLRIAMSMRGLSIAALARLCCVSQQTIRNWRAMRDPRMSAAHLIALSEILNVRAQWLSKNAGGMLPIAATAPTLKSI